jgi:hypothetical protein
VLFFDSEGGGSTFPEASNRFDWITRLHYPEDIALQMMAISLNNIKRFLFLIEMQGVFREVGTEWWSYTATSSICLHGIVLSWLRTRTTFNFTFIILQSVESKDETK